MGLLTNSDYGTTPLQRIITGIKRCQLGDIREFPRAADATEGPLLKTLVNFTLEEPAKTVDGDEVGAGFPTLISINEWEAKDERANAKYRELALAVLGLSRNSKDDVVKLVGEKGGWAALKGKSLLVEFSTSKDKQFQDAKNFNRVNNGAA